MSTDILNPQRRKPRTCEICGKTYVPTYSKQRSCGRTCGLRIRFGDSLYTQAHTLSLRDLNSPTTRERVWLDDHNRQKRAAYMLERYHADPRNWSTAKRRRELFTRDGWKCRACGKQVTDEVHATHPRRAVAGHILAKATGGEWTDENMATLCYPCNQADGVNQLPLQTHAF